MNRAAMHYHTEDAGAELVTRHAPLVKKIAYHLTARLPDEVQVDDLIQSGMMGLLEAARHFNAGHGASFETYASIRIRGAMLDEVRKQDWLPRSVHTKVRQLAEAIRAVENREGRDAQDGEVAAQLEMSLEEYHVLLNDAKGCRIVHYDDVGAEEGSFLERIPDESGEVVEQLQNQELRNQLADQIASLPEKERLVMALYYTEELNLREIGEVMGVTESRACQIRSQALLRLRSRMSGHPGKGRPSDSGAGIML